MRLYSYLEYQVKIEQIEIPNPPTISILTPEQLALLV